MTTISAGTTSTTAYVATPDTTGTLVLKTGSGNTTALTLDASQNATFAGAVSGGTSFLIPNADVFRLNAGLVGANVNTAQAVLGVGITLAANTVYAFEIVCALTKTAGATSHTIGMSYGGTATLNNIQINGTYISAQVPSAPPTGGVATNAVIAAATNLTLTSAITSTTNTWSGVFKGTVSINAGGTFIPQYTLSAAPGGAYTTVAGSYMIIYPIGTVGANTNIGGWA